MVLAITKVSTHLKWDPNSDLDKCIKLPKAASTQSSKYMAVGTQHLQATLSRRYSNVWHRATLDRTNNSSSCTYLMDILSALSNNEANKKPTAYCTFSPPFYTSISKHTKHTIDAFCCWPGFQVNRWSVLNRQTGCNYTVTRIPSPVSKYHTWRVNLYNRC